MRSFLRCTISGLALCALTVAASGREDARLRAADGKITTFHFPHPPPEWECTKRALDQGGFVVLPDGTRTTRKFQDTAHARAWLQHACRPIWLPAGPRLHFHLHDPDWPSLKAIS